MLTKGDVVLVTLDGTGVEQRGTRPAVIVQNDIGNKYSQSTIICPITSQHKNQIPTHVKLQKGNGLTKDSTVLCEQVRTIDKNRLIKKLGSVNLKEIQEINNKIQIAFGIGG